MYMDLVLQRSQWHSVLMHGVKYVYYKFTVQSLYHE